MIILKGISIAGVIAEHCVEPTRDDFGFSLTVNSLLSAHTAVRQKDDLTGKAVAVKPVQALFQLDLWIRLASVSAIGSQNSYGVLDLEITWVPCYYVGMIISFKNSGTEAIFDGANSRAARQTCPQQLWRVALRKLEQLDSATELGDLNVPPNNRLEALKRDRIGQHSIRINDQYRVCFTWTEAGPTEVEIVDYHD